MVNWVFLLIVGVALFMFFKYSNVRYERIWTYLLGFILIFFLFTFYSVTSHNSLKVGSFEDFVTGLKLYQNWLFGWVKNTATITGNVINVDWSGNFSNTTR